MKKCETKNMEECQRKKQSLGMKFGNTTSYGDVDMDPRIEEPRKADTKYDSKKLNEKEVENTKLTVNIEVGASSKARNNVTLEEKDKNLESYSASSLQTQTWNANQGIFIIFVEGAVLDHLSGGQMTMLEHHTQIKPQDDWGDEEHESEMEVEAIREDLKQAQLVVENMHQKVDMHKENGYKLNSNATKPCKFKFSSQGVQQAQWVITHSTKTNFEYVNFVSVEHVQYRQLSEMVERINLKK